MEIENQPILKNFNPKLRPVTCTTLRECASLDPESEITLRKVSPLFSSLLLFTTLLDPSVLLSM